MVAPTGGPKDSLAPIVTKSLPAEFSRNVSDKKIEISFNEYVTLKDLQKQLYTSPPMEQLPEVKEKGKKIEILLDKKLQENTTYSINFINSLVDVNENNPLKNFAYIFSTGNRLDTSKFNGIVYDAQSMLPMPDVFVYMYENDSIEAPTRHKPNVVAKTDKNGIFIANNLKNRKYKILALKDINGNQMVDPGFDDIAFNKNMFGPVYISAKPDTLKDSVYRAQLPPQIKLKMFSEPKKMQFIKGKSRTEKYKMSLIFNSQNPQIHKIEFEEKNLTINDFFVETSANSDTITYWLKDATRKIADTLIASYTYMKSDSTGALKETVEKVHWELPLSKSDNALKAKEKKEKREEAKSLQPPKTPKANPSFDAPDGTVNGEGGLFMRFSTPLVRLDTAKIVLYHIDDNDKKVRVPVTIKPVHNSITSYELVASWIDDSRYEVVSDSNIVTSIHHYYNDSIKYSFNTSNSAKFGAFVFDFKNLKSNVIVQLLDSKYKIVRQKVISKNGITKLAYIKPNTYFIRIIEDANNNGKWDTGNYLLQIEPERVAYLHKEKEDKFQLRTGWENELTIDLDEVFVNY